MPQLINLDVKDKRTLSHIVRVTINSHNGDVGSQHSCNLGSNDVLLETAHYLYF